MPTKWQIEAELNAGARDKALARLREVMNDLDEMERVLYAAEERLWQPHWSRNDPLSERLARVGVNGQLIRRVCSWMDAMSLLAAGKPLPPEFKAELAKHDAAGAAALQQLSDIVAPSGKGN